MNQEKIDRINFLARKKKSEGLTESEAAEQKELRREYIEAYKRSLLSQLDNMYYIDENGNEQKIVKKL